MAWVNQSSFKGGPMSYVAAASLEQHAWNYFDINLFCKFCQSFGPSLKFLLFYFESFNSLCVYKWHHIFQFNSLRVEMLYLPLTLLFLVQSPNMVASPAFLVIALLPLSFCVLLFWLWTWAHHFLTFY